MFKSARIFPTALALVFVVGLSPAQQIPAASKPHVEVPAIAPHAEDVATIDGIMKAFYEVISGPAGQPRQWSRDRTLYIPDIRFVALSQDKSGHPVATIVSHQQFVDDSDAVLIQEGFYESEIHRVTQRFGNIAHVFSTYESRTKAGGPITTRGINSIELFYDGQRWWIASNIWDDECARTILCRRPAGKNLSQEISNRDGTTPLRTSAPHFACLDPPCLDPPPQ